MKVLFKLFFIILIIMPGLSRQTNANSIRNIDTTFKSTYLGGIAEETSKRGAMVRDSEGNIFVVSLTHSTDFPSVFGSYDTTYNGNGDISVSKFSGDLSTLLASTYFGSAGYEFLHRNTSLSLDPEGNLYVAGQTSNPPVFPTTPGAYDSTYNGNQDIFIAKFSNDLSVLLTATLFGSPGYDEVCNIALGSDGNIFIAGYTRSDAFPVLPGAYTMDYMGTGTMPWGGELFISKFDNNLTTLIASTFLGGSDWDEGSYMVIDDSGNVIIAGSTRSNDFPTPNGYDTSFGGGTYAGDIYISRLSNDLSSLTASTYIGGVSNDWCYGISLDIHNNISISGHTASWDFPTTEGVYDRIYGGGGPDWGDDFFITILTNDLDSIIASTFIGASGWENGNSIIIDDSGFVYVGGNTNSSDYLYIPGAFDTDFNGGAVQYAGDALVVKFNPDLSEMISLSYLGGTGQEAIGSMLLDDSANLYLSGFTNSSDFPFSLNAYDTTYDGGSIDAFGGDNFVTKLPYTNFIDSDSDGVLDYGDNCPNIYNPDQADDDEDGTGNLCDYICGDINNDETVNIFDITALISYLYLNGSPPDPLESADVNHDGAINIFDITYLISFLYMGGPEPDC